MSTVRVNLNRNSTCFRMPEAAAIAKLAQAYIQWLPPSYQTLLLVVVRSKQQPTWRMINCQSIWYSKIALTNIHWWNVEMTVSDGKSELSIASPRLRTWETQLRLHLIITMINAFYFHNA